MVPPRMAHAAALMVLCMVATSFLSRTAGGSTGTSSELSISGLTAQSKATMESIKALAHLSSKKKGPSSSQLSSVQVCTCTYL